MEECSGVGSISGPLNEMVLDASPVTSVVIFPTRFHTACAAVMSTHVGLWSPRNPSRVVDWPAGGGRLETLEGLRTPADPANIFWFLICPCINCTMLRWSGRVVPPPALEVS